MKRIFALLAVAALAFGAMATATVDGPSKVWICHFEDHEAATGAWAEVEGEELDGDYVVNYAGPEMPYDNQVRYCETGETGSPTPGKLLLISVNAVDHDNDARGHGVQLLDRIGDYPGGYKG